MDMGCIYSLGTSSQKLLCPIAHLCFLKCFKAYGYFATENLLYGKIFTENYGLVQKHMGFDFCILKTKCLLAYTAK